MNEEQSSVLQEIYAGAEDAGLRIVGIAKIEIEPNDSAPGDHFTLTVRVGESGRLLPGRGDSDGEATSLLRVEVYQHTLEDSSGDRHHVWKSYARQVDVGKGRLFEASESGPTAEEVHESQAGRPAHEYLDDSEFMDETLGQSASTAAEAVRQALLPLSDGSGGLSRGRESETDVWSPEHAGSSSGVVPSDSYSQDSEGPEMSPSDEADSEGDSAQLTVEEGSALRNTAETRDSGLEDEDFEGVMDAGSPDDSGALAPAVEAADARDAPAWVKWGTPALVVAALVIAGFSLFGGGHDEDGTAASETGQASQVTEPSGAEEGTPPQQTDTQEEETPDAQVEEEPAEEPEPPQVDLVEIGRFGLIGGQAASYTTAGGFDAFFYILFVPNDVIATISALDAAEDYAAKAKQALTADRDLSVVGEAEITQYHGDPVSNPPSQPSVGAVIRINPTLFDVAAIGSDGATYTEVNVFRLFFCESYPDCGGSHIVGVNLGGPLDLDVGQAIGDALLILEQGPAGIADGYDWGFQITGDISEVAN